MALSRLFSPSAWSAYSVMLTFRGMRPYFERAPFGLGAAISHASYLQSRDDLHRRTAQELEELRQRYRRLERRARIPFAVPLGDLADGIARFARNVLRRRQR